MVVVHRLVESYVDTLVGMGSYVRRLLPYSDINELWMRGVIVILIVMFTRYGRHHVRVGRATATWNERVAWAERRPMVMLTVRL